MDATIRVTINLPVSFTATKDGIGDTLIDGDLAIDLINAELETKESEDALMAEVNDARIEWESDKAEFIFNARGDAR